MTRNFIYKLWDNFKNKKVDSQKTGMVYSREFISKMMANDYSQIIDTIDKVKMGEKLLITITPNVHYEFEEQFCEITDQFCTLFNENKAKAIVYYANPTNKFVKLCGDSLCYGNYTKGAELSEGQFEILFENPEQGQYNKIEIALGLYDDEKSKINIDFSKKYVTEFIIVIWTEGKQFCHIVENSLDTKSNFINILTLNKIDTIWSLSVDLKYYVNTKDFTNKNFDNPQINASH